MAIGLLNVLYTIVVRRAEAELSMAEPETPGMPPLRRLRNSEDNASLEAKPVQEEKERSREHVKTKQ